MVTNKDKMQSYLKAIHKATASVMESTTGLNATLKKICAAIVSIPNYNRALIAEYQEDSQIFVVLAYGGLGTKLLNRAKELAGRDVIGAELRITEEENIFIQAVKECKILTSDDIWQITRPVLTKKVSEALTKLLNISSYAVVPLYTGDEFVRGILVSSKMPEISDEEMEALETFAAAAALAIQRVKVEVKLNESEERYRQLVELSPDGIVVHSTGKVVFVNRAAVKLLGAAAPEELVGKPVMDFVHPDYREIVRKRIVQMIDKGGEVPLIEEKFIRIDGTEVDVEVAAMPFIYQGEPAVQVVIRDITTRKRMAEEIEKRQKYLESVLYDAPDAIVTLDAYHCVIEWNPGAEKIFGYTRDEVLGKNIDDLISRLEMRNEAMTLTKKVVSGEKVLPLETVRYRKDGTPVNVIVAGSPIRIGDELRGVVAVYTDITEQKRAEEALRESEEMYKTLVETSPDAVTVTDLEGNITYASTRTLELHGFENNEELIGRRAFELIALEYHEVALSNVQKTLKEGLLENVEYTLLKKDGTRFSGELSAALIKDAYGKPKAFIATTRDITDRKTAEKKLTERLDELERWQKLTVGRELKMFELKERIKELEQQLENK